MSWKDVQDQERRRREVAESKGRSRLATFRAKSETLTKFCGFNGSARRFLLSCGHDLLVFDRFRKLGDSVSCCQCEIEEKADNGKR